MLWVGWKEECCLKKAAPIRYVHLRLRLGNFGKVDILMTLLEFESSTDQSLSNISFWISTSSMTTFNWPTKPIVYDIFFPFASANFDHTSSTVCRTDTRCTVYKPHPNLQNTINWVQWWARAAIHGLQICYTLHLFAMFVRRKSLCGRYIIDECFSSYHHYKMVLSRSSVMSIYPIRRLDRSLLNFVRSKVLSWEKFTFSISSLRIEKS